MSGSLKTSKFVNPKGRPVGPKGETLYECDDCGKLWRTEDLKPAENLYERISDGDPMSSQECPDCGALAFPAEGESAQVVLGLYSTQEKILAQHDGHAFCGRIVKGKFVLFCQNCGNKSTRTVEESDISKPKLNS